MKRGMLAVAVAAALLAGCGGSSSSSGAAGGGSPSSGSSGPRLSVSAWKQKVDSICATVTKQSHAVPKPTSAADLNDYLKKLEAIGNSEIGQLKEVTPPAQFADVHKAVVDDLSTIWSKLGSVINSDDTGRKLVQDAQRFGTQIQGSAEDYLKQTRAAGLKSCVLTPATTG